MKITVSFLAALDPQYPGAYEFRANSDGFFDGWGDFGFFCFEDTIR